MQVNDSQAPPPASQAGKAGVAADGPPEARARSGRGFRTTLERRYAEPTADGGDERATAAALAGWFRAEALRAPAAATKATGVAGLGAARPVDRVLIGSGPDGAEARIRIGAGALAGTEIQLCSGPGRAVEAQLLTHAASSRQTLSVVMDEIRSRLRARGITMSTREPVGRPVAQEAVEGASAAHERGRSAEGGPMTRAGVGR